MDPLIDPGVVGIDSSHALSIARLIQGGRALFQLKEDPGDTADPVAPWFRY